MRIPAIGAPLGLRAQLAGPKSLAIRQLGPAIPIRAIGPIGNPIQFPFDDGMAIQLPSLGLAKEAEIDAELGAVF